MNDTPTATVRCEVCGREFEGAAGGRGNVHRSLSMHIRNAHPGIAVDDPAPPRDRPPLHVAVDVGVNKQQPKDPALEAVRERAEQVASGVAVALYFLGAEADAADIERRKGTWALSVQALAVHEEWLRKLAQGGQGAERVQAWVGFVAATFMMAAPILGRHGALPPILARMLAMIDSQLENVEPPPDVEPPPEPDAEGNGAPREPVTVA